MNQHNNNQQMQQQSQLAMNGSFDFDCSKCIWGIPNKIKSVTWYGCHIDSVVAEFYKNNNDELGCIFGVAKCQSKTK